MKNQPTYKTAFEVAKIIAIWLDDYSAHTYRNQDESENSHIADLRSSDPSKPSFYVKYDPEHTRVKTATITHDPLRWFDASLNKEFKRSLGYSETRPSINVNPERGGKAIANDITRRLLPDAQKAHDLDLAYQASVALNQARVKQMVDALSPLLTIKQNYHNPQEYYAYLQNHSGEITINEFGTVSLKLTMKDPEQVKRVVASIIGTTETK